jgi:hypothetical protein
MSPKGILSSTRRSMNFIGCRWMAFFFLKKDFEIAYDKVNWPSSTSFTHERI